MKSEYTLPVANLLNFIQGGKAYVTLLSLTTNVHYTYEIVKAKKHNNPSFGDTYFVSVLFNEKDEYTYVGYIRNNQFMYGSGKSLFAADAPSILAFRYLLSLAVENRESAKIKLFHSGKCCRCGRKLTHPESLETGIGPECGKRR